MALSDTLTMSLSEHQHPDANEVEQGRLSRTLSAATLLAAFTEVLHVFGGGASVWRPISESALADEPRLVSLAVWHMASVAMGLSIVALGLGALPRFAKQSRFMVVFVSVMWIGFGLSFVGTALTQPDGNAFAQLPQPILLLPVGILGLAGIARHR